MTGFHVPWLGGRCASAVRERVRRMIWLEWGERVCYGESMVCSMQREGVCECQSEGEKRGVVIRIEDEATQGPQPKLLQASCPANHSGVQIITSLALSDPRFGFSASSRHLLPFRAIRVGEVVPRCRFDVDEISATPSRYHQWPTVLQTTCAHHAKERALALHGRLTPSIQSAYPPYTSTHHMADNAFNSSRFKDCLAAAENCFSDTLFS